MRTLYVLNKISDHTVPSGATVLTFLNPEEETILKESFVGKLLTGRVEMNAIRKEARQLYVDLVSNIGSTRCYGKTLRERLNVKGKGNSWWYHPFTAKNSMDDPTFNRLLQILTIAFIAEKEQSQKIEIYNGSHEVANVLSSRFQIIKKGKFEYDLLHPIRGIFARIKYLYLIIRDHIALNRSISLPEINPDIVFEGFWNWSVKLNKQNKLEDVYFSSLPNHLISNGFSCAWLLWLDPHFKNGPKGQTVTKILEFAKKHPQLIFLQKFISINNIFRAIVDFRPLFHYLWLSNSKQFRAIAKVKNFDFWPLIDRQLLYGFCNSTLPHHTLGELAHRRAFEMYRPKFSFTFQEFYLWSRACYQGARLGDRNTIRCNIQHASYNREKTFILIDAEREFNGFPDNHMMPTPDYIFAMGELGRTIFIENGFSTERVILSGSVRYDQVKFPSKKLERVQDKKYINVLLTPTLNLELELEMIQAAVLAVKGLKAKLHLRSHPFNKMEDWPNYKPYLSKITSTTGSLKEDLEMADLVLFSFSTVAEEALLLGIPVCQWQSAKFNGSVFKDIPLIPSFSSVDELAGFLRNFIEQPKLFQPTLDTKKLVAHQCFYKTDGMAAQRIVKKLLEISNSELAKVDNKKMFQNALS